MDYIKSFSIKSKLISVYWSGILLTFHYALIIYINSSFLGTFFSATVLSLIYTTGAILSIIVFSNISKLLQYVGAFRITVISIILEGIAVLGLALFQNPKLAVVLFLIHTITIPIIFFGLDLFLENISKDESETGRIRSTYLTFSNVMFVIAPIIVGFLLGAGNYPKIYLLSSIFLLPLVILITKYFKDFPKQTISKIDLLSTIKRLFRNSDLKNVTIIQGALQLFYAWMVIYTPIYLHQHIGFEWSQIGLIFTIMLLPFILFEMPIGRLADLKMGEKEIMIIGLLIMGLASGSIFFITEANFILWASVLFITRIGASFVEITTESYFFKHVTDRDTGIISFFRMTRPVAYIIAPLIGAISLAILDYRSSFLILGTIMILSIWFGLKIKDTR